MGGFLKAILHEEGIECPSYPSFSIVRNSPPGQIDTVWSIGQLVQCYAVTEAYLIEADDVMVKDETGEYGVSYFAVVLRREEKGWIVQVFTDKEDIYPETEDQRKLMERFGRFAARAQNAILSFVE
jgi:hypothetical protein